MDTKAGRPASTAAQRWVLGLTATASLLQAGLGYGPLGTGLRLLPWTATLFFAARIAAAPGRSRFLPTRANGQPAVALYLRGDDGGYRPPSVQLLTVGAGGIARITAFLDASLFGTFGLPDRWDAATATVRR